MSVRSITRQQVLSIMTYDPETGLFKYLSTRGRAKAGDVAGYKNYHGYIYIRLLGKLICAHRLAYLCHFGFWPCGEIDHINGLRDDNRISNLRVVTKSGNQQNQGVTRNNNPHGLIGVRYDKRRRKYCAQITAHGITYWCGYHDTAEDARAAYLEKKLFLHETSPTPRAELCGDGERP